MVIEKEDRTARAIRERRERAAGAPAAPVVVVRGPDTTNAVTKKPGLSEEKRAEVRQEIEALKDRPLLRARRVAQYLAEGLTPQNVADALNVRRPWVSKRLMLAQAPLEVLQQIEFGNLTEHEYINNRERIEAELTGEARAPKYQRPLTLPINLDAARAVAEILGHLATSLGAIPIRLDDKPNKKQITEIINLRAAELRSLFVKK